MSRTNPFRFRVQLPNLGHARYNIAGHSRACDGNPEPSVRHIDGCYHAALGCKCGADRKIGRKAHATFAAAQQASQGLA